MDIIEKLRAIKNATNFTQKQKSLACYIVENHVRICFLSLANICKESGCSEVTFLNFCKKLGYKNFMDLKKDFRKYTEHKILAPSHNIKNYCTDLSTNEFYQKVINSELNYLNEFFNSIDADKFITIAETITEARYMVIVGHDWSNKMSLFLKARLSALKLATILVDPSDLIGTEYIINGITKDAFIFFFSFPPYFYGTEEIGKHISKQTDNILLITNSDSSPAAPYIKEKIICNTYSEIFDNTWIAPLSFIDIITNMTAIMLRREKQYTELIK